MTDIVKMLDQQIAAWEILGHPAMLERFVRRNGKLFFPTKRIGTKREPKACFANAAHFVTRLGGAYVEGYVMNAQLPLLFHHAWVTTTGSDAMDPTLTAKKYEYYGVEFAENTMRRELLRNKVYGLLDPGLGFNVRLMFEIDPALEAICNAVKNRRKDFANALLPQT